MWRKCSAEKGHRRLTVIVPVVCAVMFNSSEAPLTWKFANELSDFSFAQSTPSSL
jgi:hypothetical protein